MKLRFGPERPVNVHFDWLAPVYDRLAPPADAAKLRELLRLPASGGLLDAGGGTGRVSFRLAGAVGRVVVLDLSLPMLRQARRKEALHAVRADVRRLPFPARSFARILVVDALHHFADPQEVLCELFRVLEPGGRLVIQEFDRRRPAVRLLVLLEKLLLMGSWFPSPERIAQMAAACGAAAAILPNGRFSVWIVADKPS
ncbi:MAG: methyltransferase domain-containing protein [Desulfobacteraceae bacterium]|nr:methyltransferase domain-containing protein [Desulfobacteraceae bacterium]